MCYHKSLVQKYLDLMEHYSASFNSITEDMELVKERFSFMMSRDAASEPYCKEEVKEMTMLKKTINSFTETEFQRYHENGFEYLPTPVITLGAHEEFKMFRWGFIPSFIKKKEDAMGLRLKTSNCISEEMYDSVRDR